jgi:tetratricopeptide (TPR) repeat protein
VDAGRFTAKQTIILTDFRASAADSSFAALSRDALSITIQQSGFVGAMSPGATADALTRMRVNPSQPVTLQRAREIARREGIGVIVDGELVRSGSDVTLFVRLIAADSGTSLALLPQPLGAPSELLEAIDGLGKRLRSKLGESLEQVHRTPPLEKVTTASMEALMHFTRAVRLRFTELNLLQAINELKQAVTIDTSFAAAWRLLATTLTSARLSGSTVNLDARFQNPIAHAYENRAQATEVERLTIEGTYFTNDLNIDKAKLAYERVWAITGSPPPNLGFVLLGRREYARAESVYRIVHRNPPAVANSYEDFIGSLINQGKYRAADSVGRLARRRFPNSPMLALRTAQIACFRRFFDACDAGLDSVIALGAGNEAEAKGTKAAAAVYRGQIARADQIDPAPKRADPSKPRYGDVSGDAFTYLRVSRRPDRALALLDSVEDRIGRTLDAALAFAEAGAPDRAKDLVGRYRRQNSDTAQWYGVHVALAAIAQAEGRWSDAITEWKAADVDAIYRRPFGPATQVMPFGVAVAYDSARMLDSAIHWYERAVATPMYYYGPGSLWHPAMRNPAVHERLGQLYEAAGNRRKAREHLTTFIDLWKDADPELQPRVADARARLARLRSPPIG